MQNLLIENYKLINSKMIWIKVLNHTLNIDKQLMLSNAMLHDLATWVPNDDSYKK